MAGNFNLSPNAYSSGFDSDDSAENEPILQHTTSSGSTTTPLARCPRKRRELELPRDLHRGGQTRSVCGIDLEGDGDVDALSASDNDDTIVWSENLNGRPVQPPRLAMTREEKLGSTTLALFGGALPDAAGERFNEDMLHSPSDRPALGGHARTCDEAGTLY